MSVLHDFDFQTRIWGWAVWSRERPRDGLRNPALAFEHPERREARWWDRTPRDFVDVQLISGGKVMPTPWWWALCASLYMTEYPA